MAAAAAAPWRPTARTASVCTAEMARGTHSFRIEGYSLHKGNSTRCVLSSTFAVGGHDWRIHFLPEGPRDSIGEHASIYLKLVGDCVGVVRAAYSFFLVDPATGEPLLLFSAKADFTAAKWSWGTDYFIKKTHLEATYLRGDCLVIECDVAVLKQALVGKEMAAHDQVQVPPSDLADNLLKFLNEEEEVDVTFEVKGEVFRAHRILLAMRSPVFKAELYGPWRRNKGMEESITVEDMEPAVFKALLHFISTDSLPAAAAEAHDDEEMAKHLLVAADRYAMERMRLISESILCEKINAENVATILVLADQHHCSKLKDACLAFINSPDKIDDVVASKGYDLLKRQCPYMFMDIWERAVKSRKI